MRARSRLIGFIGFIGLPVCLAGQILCFAGCAPDLGAPQSLINSNRILAIVADRAEVAPGAPVQLRALVATPQGTLPPGDKGYQFTWDFCVAPKPLDENNAVSGDCQPGGPDGGVDPIEGVGQPVTGTVPTNACALFGSDPPPSQPGKPALRARDPDVTGGYYQPVRLHYFFGGPGGSDLFGFGLERISCNLGNAPIDIVQQFRQRYKVNKNPRLARVTATVDGGVEQQLRPEGDAAAVGPLDPGALISVKAGSHLVFHSYWSADSVESYPVYDIENRRLCDHTEALRVSWFSGQTAPADGGGDLCADPALDNVHCGGVFEHDRTGLPETICSSDDGGAPLDMSVLPDLSMPPADLASSPMDLATNLSMDLSGSPDLLDGDGALAMSMDAGPMLPADLATPADLSIAPDLSSPPDLSPPAPVDMAAPLVAAMVPTDNGWTAPSTPGRVFLWVVLRDSRGGVDYASFQIDVTAN